MKAAVTIFGGCIFLALVAVTLMIPAPVTRAQYVPPTPTPPIPDIYPPHVIPDDALASVLWPRVNVRSAPSVENSVVITIIEIGDLYPIVGANADETWWQLNVDGTRGWVLADLVIAVNIDEIPDEQAARDAQMRAFNRALVQQLGNPRIVTVRNTLNVRAAPTTQTQLVGRVPAYGLVTVIGRNRYGTWWQVQYGSVTGWVSGYYLNFRPDFPIHDIPING